MKEGFRSATKLGVEFHGFIVMRLSGINVGMPLIVSDAIDKIIAFIVLSHLKSDYDYGRSS